MSSVGAIPLTLIWMSVNVLHSSLALVTAAAAIALVASGAWAAYRRTSYSIHLVLVIRRVTIIAVVLAAAVGALLFVTGHRPQAGLHLMYGVLALVTVPVAASMAARNPRRGGIYHLFAGVLLLGFWFRLSTTG